MMLAAEQISNLKNQGLYDGLVKAGIISVSINYWYEIYNYYQTRLTVNAEFDNSKTRSFEETEEAFDCSEMTIRRSIKFMETKTTTNENRISNTNKG